MPSPDLATRVGIADLRLTFGADQMKASVTVKQSSGSVNLNPEYYLIGPSVSRARVAEDVDKFAAEHYYMATGRKAFFDGENWYHLDGEKYRDFFGRAIEHHKDSPHLVRRFSAEGEGYDNAGYIINKSLQAGLDLPTIAIASPPGEVYRANKSFQARNVTFLLVPVGANPAKLGEFPEKIYQEYMMYVVPSPETTTEEHLSIVASSSDLETSLLMLGMTADMVREGDADFVVALPFILEEAIDKIAQRLDRDNFAAIVEEAEKMFDLENDSLARVRRQDMNNYFTDKMWGYISRRDSLTKQERLRLKALCDVMHDYMSLEAGMEYVGMTFEDIRKDIEAHTMIQYKNTGVNFTVHELRYTDWQYAESAYARTIYMFANNARARESRSNAGCPVNMKQSLFSSRFGGIESYSDGFGYDMSQSIFSNLTESFEYVSTSTEISYGSGNDEPEGRYSEGVYKPGHCRSCDKDKKKVWHVEDGGCNCCTSCEHKLAGKD